MPTREMSDKGLSIFTFAAYHQLSSGEKVTEIVLRDGSGHSADPDGLREVEALGLIEPDGSRGVLTDRGVQFLDKVLEQIRGAAKFAAQTTAVA
jgi:ribosomal protein S19E (S16A)